MTRWIVLLALCSAGFACGGSGGGFDPDAGDTTIGDTTVADTAPLPDPVTPAWRRLYGRSDTQGISSNQESVQGLAVDADGNVILMADLRYRDDPNRDDVLLVSYEPDGKLRLSKQLRFERGVTPLALRVLPDGNLLLAVEHSDLSLYVVTPSGEPVWSKSYDREPYAFGGLHLGDIQVDAGGNIYLAGALNPSEANDGRGFAAKLSASGEPQWLRTWTNAAFAKGQRIAVGTSGVYVLDRVEGTQEINTKVIMFSFGLDGTTRGQRTFYKGGSADIFDSLSRAAVSATDIGAVVIGTSSTAVDGNFALLIHRVTLDADLTLVSNDGTRVPTSEGLFSSAIRLVSEPDGSLAATLNLETGPGVVTYGPGETVATAWELVRDDGLTPLLEDDDFATLIELGPDGSLYLAATADTPGTVSLQPKATMAQALPMAPVADAVTVHEDTLVTEETGSTVTVTDNEVSDIDEETAGDEDILVMRVSL